MNRLMDYLYESLKDDPIYWEQYELQHGFTHHDEATDYWYNIFSQEEEEESYDSHHMPTYTPTATHHVVDHPY